MAVYVVKPGDNLWAVSRLYGVPIQSIVELNGLESAGAIVPGLAIYIPDNEQPIRYYRIKSGDTLWRLAARFSTTIPDILSANPGLDPSRLYIDQPINLPSPLPLEIDTLGFVVPYSQEALLPIIGQLAGQLTYLAISAYSFTNEGYAYVELEDRTIVSRSVELNIVPLLMIRNLQGGEFSAELVGRVLQSPVYRQNLILSLVNLARQRGYGGISIDFEFIPPPQRNDFSLFLTDLKAALGDLILHVNVHAKTADIPTNRIIGAYDYEAIGRAADLVAVMTIDYGYPTGPPDPVAPLWWMYQVVRYSLTQINPSKLQIAMPLYGYDKVAGTNITKALSVQGAQNLAISKGSVIRYDTAAQAPWFRYWVGTEEHIVWFEDIRSYMAKYKLMDQYSLGGTTFWQLRLPAPQNWAYLRNEVIVRKRLGL